MRKSGSKFIAVMLAVTLAMTPVSQVSAKEVTVSYPEIEQNTAVPEESTEAPESEAPSTETPESDIPSTETPGSEVPSTEEPSVTEPTTEVPETETADDNTVSGNETDEGTISSNTAVSGNAVSSNTVSANEAESLFPGMPDGYTLSADAMSERNSLLASMGDFSQYKEGEDYAAREVVFLSDTKEEAEIIAAAYGGELLRYTEGVAVVKLKDGVTVQQALQAATGTDVVLPPVWPNYIMEAMGEVQELTSISTEKFKAEASAYNDIYLNPSIGGYQWQHNAVGSLFAWKGGFTGKGVKVAVLDTGAYNHEDVMFVDSFNATETDSVLDIDGHGTHVAGIVGATKDNGLGGAGIAPEAELYGVKVLDDDGYGYADYAMSGIRHAINTFNVDIINMSLGGVGYSEAYKKVIQEAVDHGTVVIAAAGNDSSSTKAYPGAYDNVICVAATNSSGAKASFSNFGSWVDLCAPGVNILSATTRSSDDYDFMSGTSQATPVISGAAAVILSADLAALKGKSGAAKVSALKKVLTSNVTKGSGSGIGAGIVNLPKALKVSTVLSTPVKPVFDQKTNTSFDAESTVISIKAEAGTEVYYSVNGKVPTFKEGVITNGELYTGPITVGGAAKVTVKAIAVNIWGKASSAASATYQFKAPVSGITISGPNKVLQKKSIALTAVITPLNAGDKSLEWSVSKLPEGGSGVTVNKKNGKVTAAVGAVAGNYEITAKSANGITGTYEITVIDKPTVKTIKFKSSTVKLDRVDSNTTYELSDNLDVDLSAGGKGTVGDVTFSSNNSGVAEVFGSQLIIKNGGKATITALANDGSGIKKSFTVQVTQHVTSMVIEGINTIGRKTSSAMKAVLTPSNVVNKKVEWSIAPEGKGVTINKTNGKVTVAKDASLESFTITAKSADIVEGSSVAAVATKVITVTEGAIKKISFDRNSVTVYRTGVYGNKNTGQGVEIKIDGTSGYSPNAYTVINGNKDIIDIYKEGNVLVFTATGRAVGKATVTVQSTDGSNKKATVKVTVANPVSNVLVSPEAGRTDVIGLGKKLKLNATLETDNGPISNKGVIWEIQEKEEDHPKEYNAKAVEIDKKGVVTAKEKGVVIIRARAADGCGAYGEYVVEVREAIKSLSLPVTGNVLELGTTFTVPYMYDGKYFCELTPDGMVIPSDYDISIEVSNPDVIAVKSSFAKNAELGGYFYSITLYALKEGNASIKLKAMDGSGATFKYNFIVKK